MVPGSRTRTNAERYPWEDLRHRGRHNAFDSVRRIIAAACGRRHEPAVPPLPNGEDARASEARAAVARIASSRRHLLNRCPRKAAFEIDGLLAEIGYLDLVPERRFRAATIFATRLPAPLQFVSAVIVDILETRGVRSLGAVFAKRVPKLLSADPSTALSRRWRRCTVAEVLRPYTNEGKTMKPPRTSQSVHEPVDKIAPYEVPEIAPRDIENCREALALYRAGRSIAEIAETLGVGRDEVGPLVRKAMEYIPNQTKKEMTA